MFEKVSVYSGDSILTLMEEFKVDPRPNKINLSIGLYYDDAGYVPVPRSVQISKAQIGAEISTAQTYLPMSGLAELNSGIQRLLFGPNSQAIAQKRVVTVQTIGGSGALKVGADFLHSAFPRSGAWVSNPTWDNHIGILEGAGFEVFQYPYFDAKTGSVDFAAMAEQLDQLPLHSIVLLHPCCHNPTGADLSMEQWDQVITIIQRRSLVPLLDIAYQGFGKDMDEDAYLIRALESAGGSFLVANSFSKICSVYGERVGGLSVVCSSTEEADRVGGQLQAKIRRNYSSPPAFGARIVSGVLLDGRLRQSWIDEVSTMRQRILDMRATLHQALSARVPQRNFDYLVQQRGMFSYTGLTATQVQTLRDDFGIYLVRSGRLCLSGLRNDNVETVADAVAQVLRSGDACVVPYG